MKTVLITGAGTGFGHEGRSRAFLRAYATATHGLPGPVCLSLPMDDMDKECPARPARRNVCERLSAGQRLAVAVEVLERPPSS
jgi:benzoylformate decarboxylase